MKILVINGPNLNYLGIRNTKVYGTETYETLVERLSKTGEDNGVLIECFQSNCEGELIDRIQQACHEELIGVVINPGAYAHYSIALRDALETLRDVFSIPVIEVHISNIYSREEFRHVSVTAPVCKAQISGLGTDGYFTAVEWLIHHKNGKQCKL